MAHLDLAGVSADGRRLLLVDRQGEEFSLEISSALRAALRGETTRTAALENEMTSTLRPRDIQARIRAGETPEAVAAAAQTTVEAILPFVGPVLGEREHVARRAQTSSLRRPAGDTGSGTRILGDAVSGHLSARQARAADIAWDAFRREDGRWEVVGAFETTERAGTARFTFDVPGNYVTADNDDARWLVGDLAAEPFDAFHVDDLRQVRERRLVAVTSDQLPLGDDVLDMVGDPPAAPAHDDPLRDTSDEVAPDPAATADAVPDDAPHHRRPVAKKRGRASVPSWDEIMFGSND